MGSIRRAPRTGNWEIRYRDPNGRQRTVSKGLRTKEDARARLAAIETDKMRGEWLDPRLGRITFAEWSEEYIEGAVHKRATTLAQDRQRLRKHLIPAFGDMRLAAITPLDVRRFVEALARDMAPSTVRTIYGCLRTILNASVAADLLAVTPCRGIKLPPKRASEKQVLTVEELHRLAEAMPAEYKAMIYLSAVGSLRFEELAGLRVRRLNFLRRPATVEVVESYTAVGGFNDTKSPASRRTIQLPPFLVEMLAEHLAQRGSPGPDELVFVSPRGGPLVMTNFHRRSWTPSLKRAGLEGFVFHGLRHSTVGLMVEMGHHPLVIQRRLGHSSSHTTMDIYGHVLAALDDGVTEDFETLFVRPKGTKANRAGGSSSS